MVAVPTHVEEFLAKLRGVRRRGEGWTACCPAHADDHPSLDVDVGKDGRILIVCRSAGCPAAAVVKALGLTQKALFPPADRPDGKARIVATYDYRDESGTLLFQAVRFDPKDFRQRRPDGRGGWVWRLDGVRRVLYRLPELLAADPASPVFVAEGEKDADALARLGLVATTNACGATKWRHTDPAAVAAALAGRRVVVLPDNDGKGEEHAADVANRLAGVAASVAVLRLPGLPAKGDVSDWLAAGGTADDLLRRAAAAPAATADDPAPVLVSPAEHETIDAAVAALAGAAGLYQRGDLLVRVVERPADRGPAAGSPLFRPAGPRVLAHDPDTVREELTRRVRFYREKDDGERVAVHVPGWCAKAVVKRKAWPGVPELLAVVTYPVLLPGGRVLSEPGYDPESGLYLHGDFAALAVPDDPTRDDAAAAARVLADLVADFPFQSDAHAAAWACALLTPLARYCYDGPTPLFLFDANIPGAGKSLLAELVATVVAGTDFARTAYAADRAEVRKAITSFVMAGDPLVLFDNVAGRLGDASLDAALTATRWKDRVLGSNQLFDGPLTAVFYATANNCEVSGDTARRVLPCRIVTPEEHPEDRTGFRHVLPEHARRHRGELLAAALTVLRAYERAGRPAVTTPDGRPPQPWGSYGGWSALVRAAVVWAGLADPIAGRDQLRRESDRDARGMAELLEELSRLDPKGEGFTTREVFANAGGDQVAAGWQDAAAVLTDLDVSSAAKLSYKFRHHKGRNFGGRTIELAGGRRRAGNRWVVRPAIPARPDPSAPSAPSAHRTDPAGEADADPRAGPDHLHPASAGGNGKPDNGLWDDGRSNGADGADESGRAGIADDGGTFGADAGEADGGTGPGRLFGDTDLGALFH